MENGEPLVIGDSGGDYQMLAPLLMQKLPAQCCPIGVTANKSTLSIFSLMRSSTHCCIFNKQMYVVDDFVDVAAFLNNLFEKAEHVESELRVGPLMSRLSLALKEDGDSPESETFESSRLFGMLLKSMNDRLESMNDRLESMNDRLESINDRLESMNNPFHSTCRVIVGHFQ